MNVALLCDPSSDLVALLDLHGVLRFGRERVLDEGDRGTGRNGKLGCESAVAGGAPENPAASVHVQDDRQPSVDAAWLDEQDPDIADLCRDGDPSLIDIGHRNTRLRAFDRLADLSQRQFGKSRPLGEVRGHLCGRLLEVVLARGSHALDAALTSRPIASLNSLVCAAQGLRVTG